MRFPQQTVNFGCFYPDSIRTISSSIFPLCKDYVSAPDVAICPGAFGFLFHFHIFLFHRQLFPNKAGSRNTSCLVIPSGLSNDNHAIDEASVWKPPTSPPSARL